MRRWERGPQVRPSPLGRAAEDYLVWLLSHGYAETTVANRRHHLDELVEFLAERDMAEPRAVSFSALESYQRHLFHHKKRDGAPLSFRTQAQRIIGAKGFFSWMTSHGLIALDPASGIVLPKAEHRLPEATLSAEEADAVLSGPDVTTALGLRDRAVMEVLYSSAIRRAELIALKLWDIDHDRGTVFVRQGKGGRDRYAPIGPRALSWVDRYLELVRPRLVVDKTDTLFLSASGAPLCADWLSRTVTAYISAGAPKKPGSCHMFRHSAATLMLEGGADIRYVAEMLGHAKLETTAIYTRVSIAKLRAVHAATHPAGGSQTA